MHAHKKHRRGIEPCIFSPFPVIILLTILYSSLHPHSFYCVCKSCTRKTCAIKRPKNAILILAFISKKTHACLYIIKISLVLVLRAELDDVVICRFLLTAISKNCKISCSFFVTEVRYQKKVMKKYFCVYVYVMPFNLKKV